MNKYKLYILELESKNYYVGISTDPDYRFEQHIGEVTGGAEWTKLHKPVRLLYVSDSIDYSMRKSEVIEKLVTIELMKLVGRDHVRGSHYSQINQNTVDYYLGKEQILQIDAAYIINLKKPFETWSDQEKRKYFRELIAGKIITDRDKEIKKAKKTGKKEYCGITNCVYNSYKRCRFGYNPYKDEIACNSKRILRV